ncbi:MAG: hypothetical protein LC797_24895, partial [Chloroflexi bacterium]|nr:hypothetical protein [Chloroflexota bacterium]
ARSALVGAVVVVVYFAALARGRGVARLLGFGLVGGAALYLATPYMPQGSALYRLLGGSGALKNQVTGSNSQHLDALHTAISQIGTHPWTGTGFTAGLAAHNLELEAADIGGVLALVGIILVWGTVFALLWRQLRFGVPREHWLRASLLVGVLGYFSLAQFENIFWDRHLWFFVAVALLAAPAVGPPSYPDRDEGDPSTTERSHRHLGDAQSRSITV